MICQFYDIKVIPSIYDIIKVTNLLIQPFFVESLRAKRGKHLLLNFFPIITLHYIHSIYIYITKLLSETFFFKMSRLQKNRVRRMVWDTLYIQGLEVNLRVS